MWISTSVPWTLSVGQVQMHPPQAASMTTGLWTLEKPSFCCFTGRLAIWFVLSIECWWITTFDKLPRQCSRHPTEGDCQSQQAEERIGGVWRKIDGFAWCVSQPVIERVAITNVCPQPEWWWCCLGRETNVETTTIGTPTTPSFSECNNLSIHWLLHSNNNNKKQTTNNTNHIMATCSSPGCNNAITSNLACPTCAKLGLAPAYFCTQDCFKTNWATHKQVHALAKQIMAAQGYVSNHQLCYMHIYI